MRESGAFSKVELEFFRAGEAAEAAGAFEDEPGSWSRPFTRPATEPTIAEEDDPDEWEWMLAVARARATAN